MNLLFSNVFDISLTFDLKDIPVGAYGVFSYNAYFNVHFIMPNVWAVQLIPFKPHSAITYQFDCTLISDGIRCCSIGQGNGSRKSPGISAAVHVP